MLFSPVHRRNGITERRGYLSKATRLKATKQKCKPTELGGVDERNNEPLLVDEKIA